MGKKILDSKILYMVLSVLISLSLWLYITSRDENKESDTFSLPVSFEGQDILAERSLMIVNEDVTVNVEVRATPMILARLSTDPPRLTANVSSINSEGKHRVVYSHSLPSGIGEGDVEFISGASGTAVDVEVARYLRREGVEIRGEFQGTAAEGYLAGKSSDFLFNPATLTISGRAEFVNQVAYARVVITGEGLTETVSEERPFELIGASGNPLDLDITCDVDMIYTNYPILATAEIPLEVKLQEGGGLKERDVKVELSTSAIMVAGSREAVDGLVNQGAINLLTIDLAELDEDVVDNGGERVYTTPIPLTDALENVSGITEVKVTLRVTKRGVETREFEITNGISAVNAPAGWEPNIITQALKVRIRGTAKLLDELTEEDIYAVANLKDITPTSGGQYTVEARVYVNSTSSENEVGVVDPGSYTVVVALTRADG